MNNLSLNFFGEKVEIKIPETLANLRQQISDKFLFSPSETAEILITYGKDLGKKIIQTEKDFEDFIKKKDIQNRFRCGPQKPNIPRKFTQNKNRD